jgi:hypothetical protein
MPRAYYSTVFTESAFSIWQAIRAFDHYSWAGPGIEANIEDCRAGDSVGAVRLVVTPDRPIRQRLLAHSDIDRSYSYEFCDATPYPVRDYRATLRVTPITDGDRAFVEWWATFDCDDADRDRMIEQFERQGFAVWLASLREHLGS